MNKPVWGGEIEMNERVNQNGIEWEKNPLEPLIRAEDFLKTLQSNHIHYFLDYKLTEAAFKKPPSTEFIRNLDKFSPQNEVYNGEEIFLSLLEQVKDLGYKYHDLSPEETQEGVKKIFQYLENNTPVTSSPHDAKERKIFYDRLKRGYGYISNVIQQEYLEKRLEPEQVYSCIEMIGKGSHYCAGRWRQVLDELIIGFSHRMKEIGEETEVTKDRMLKPIEECFYKARTVISNKLSEDFVKLYYSDISSGNRLHYVTFFQRHLNKKLDFNLPITQEDDPYLAPEKKYLEGFADYFINTKNVKGMVLDTAIEILMEKIKIDNEFYEGMVDFGKNIYYKNQLKLVKDDEVEFLSEDFFKGFSKDIKMGAITCVLKEKQFIHEGERLEIDKKKLSDHIKKLIKGNKWEDFKECLKECEDKFKENPLLKHNVILEEGTTPLITILIAMNQVEIVRKFIQLGVDLNQEDFTHKTIIGYNPFSATRGKKPLHQAVLTGDSGMIILLLENGADPFGGKIVHLEKSYTPFELAMSQMRYDLMNIFGEFQIEKNKDRMIAVSNGEVPFLNYLISKRITGLAEKLILKGANLEAEEREEDNLQTVPSYYKSALAGRNPLHMAIAKSDIRLIQLMLEKGANPFKGNLKTFMNRQEILYSPIDYAALLGRTSAINLLLEHDMKKCIEHKVTTPYGKKSLMRIMIERGELNIVRKLVEGGEDVNQIDLRDGLTPLHLAVALGRKKLVKYMIEQGGNPFIKTFPTGRCVFSPFEVALGNKDLNMVDTILMATEEKGFSKPLKGIKLIFEDGTTPVLTYLIARGFRNAAKELILSRENINEQDVSDKTSWEKDLVTPLNGKTPLHVAVKMRDQELVKLLLEKGANTQLAMKTGMFSRETPLQLAEKNGYTEIVHLIKMHKARNVNMFGIFQGRHSI